MPLSLVPLFSALNSSPGIRTKRWMGTSVCKLRRANVLGVIIGLHVLEVKSPWKLGDVPAHIASWQEVEPQPGSPHLPSYICMHTAGSPARWKAVRWQLGSEPGQRSIALSNPRKIKPGQCEVRYGTDINTVRATSTSPGGNSLKTNPGNTTLSAVLTPRPKSGFLYLSR